MLFPQIPSQINYSIYEKYPGKKEVIVSAPESITKRIRFVPGNTPIGKFKNGVVTLKSNFSPIQFGKLKKNHYTAR
jgi:hypothetical protein